MQARLEVLCASAPRGAPAKQFLCCSCSMCMVRGARAAPMGRMRAVQRDGMHSGAMRGVPQL